MKARDPRRPTAARELAPCVDAVTPEADASMASEIIEDLMARFRAAVKRHESAGYSSETVGEICVKCQEYPIFFSRLDGNL